LAERAGGEVYAAQCRFRVDAQQCVVSAEGVESLFGKPAFQRKCGVEGKAGVSFGENESVSIGIVRRACPQDRRIQRGENFDNAKAGTDVADVGSLRLVQDDAAHVPRGDGCHRFSG